MPCTLRLARPVTHAPVILCCLFGMLLISAAAAEAQDDRPNIVLVMADDQGYGDMGYYDHPHLKTPHFDEASKAGLRFDRFYAAAPVCSPTRASVMTGRTPNRMGVFKWGYPMRPQEVTLAEVLKSAGYATGHFGKWHLGSVRNDSPAHPGRNGFDRWLSAPNFYDNDPVLSREGEAVQMKGESSMVAVDAALGWIQSIKDQPNPFLAVVWFGSPHSPHRAVEQDRRLYEEHPKQRQHFYGEITGMDRAFGKLRETLGDWQLRDNTILWYCSDNGALPKVGSTRGRRGAKNSVYEGGLLVPSFVEWPAMLSTPQTTEVRCCTFDIYPTLLSLVGAQPDHQPVLDGIDLTPLLKGDMQSRPKPLGFWHHVHPGIGTPSAKWMGELLAAQKQGRDLPAHTSSQSADRLPSPKVAKTEFPGHSAWIDGDWKLHRIQPKRGGLTWELYNLKEDPNESRNVLDQHPEQAKRMRSELVAWLESVVDSLNGVDYVEGE